MQAQRKKIHQLLNLLQRQRRQIQKVRRIIQMEKQYTELQLGKDIIMIQIVEEKIHIQQL